MCHRVVAAGLACGALALTAAPKSDRLLFETDMDKCRMLLPCCRRHSCGGACAQCGRRILRIWPRTISYAGRAWRGLAGSYRGPTSLQAAAQVVLVLLLGEHLAVVARLQRHELRHGSDGGEALPMGLTRGKGGGGQAGSQTGDLICTFVFFDWSMLSAHRSALPRSVHLYGIGEGGPEKGEVSSDAKSPSPTMAPNRARSNVLAINR